VSVPYSLLIKFADLTSQEKRGEEKKGERKREEKKGEEENQYRLVSHLSFFLSLTQILLDREEGGRGEGKGGKRRKRGRKKCISSFPFWQFGRRERRRGKERD